MYFYAHMHTYAYMYVPLMSPTSTSLGHQPAVSTTLAALIFLNYKYYMTKMHCLETVLYLTLLYFASHCIPSRFYA